MAVSIKIAGAAFTKVISAIAKGVNFSTLVGGVKSGDDTTGYTYAFNPVGTTNKYANTSNLKLPAGVDGYFEAVFSGGVNSLLSIIACRTNDVQLFTNTNSQVGIFLPQIADSDKYSALFNNGSGTTQIVTGNTANRVYVPGDVIRLRRTAGKWFSEVSSDGGETFSVIYSFITASDYNLDVFPMLGFPPAGSGSATLGNVKVFRGVTV